MQRVNINQVFGTLLPNFVLICRRTHSQAVVASKIDFNVLPWRPIRSKCSHNNGCTCGVVDPVYKLFYVGINPTAANHQNFHNIVIIISSDPHHHSFAHITIGNDFAADEQIHLKHSEQICFDSARKY